MPTKTEAKSSKAETPFGAPVWPWNQPPLCGEPTRQRCQSIVSYEESQAGVKLVAAYRVQESVVAVNDIDARAIAFEKPHAVRGVGAELLRREMAACDHDAFLAAQAELAKLRQEALALVTPIVKRLAKSLSDELNNTALVAEERLAKAGLPVPLALPGSCTPTHSSRRFGLVAGKLRRCSPRCRSKPRSAVCSGSARPRNIRRLAGKQFGGGSPVAGPARGVSALWHEPAGSLSAFITGSQHLLFSYEWKSLTSRQVFRRTTS